MSIILGLIAGWSIGMLLFMAYESYVKSRGAQKCRKIQADYEQHSRNARLKRDKERVDEEQFIMNSLIYRETGKWPGKS